MIASQLDDRLRANLGSKNNLFVQQFDASSFSAHGSSSRPGATVELMMRAHFCCVSCPPVFGCARLVHQPLVATIPSPVPESSISTSPSHPRMHIPSHPRMHIRPPPAASAGHCRAHGGFGGSAASHVDLSGAASRPARHARKSRQSGGAPKCGNVANHASRHVVFHGSAEGDASYACVENNLAVVCVSCNLRVE